jgi:Mg2+/citrate symporter
MTERMESLLAELVEMQRRQLANQERAFAAQQEALARQQEASRRAKRLTFVINAVLILVVIGIVVIPILDMLTRMKRP